LFVGGGRKEKGKGRKEKEKKGRRGSFRIIIKRKEGRTSDRERPTKTDENPASLVNNNNNNYLLSSN
jgi:hypothetical protein